MRQINQPKQNKSNIGILHTMVAIVAWYLFQIFNKEKFSER